MRESVKPAITFMLLSFLFLHTAAQEKAEEFLELIPPVPGNICGINRSVAENYQFKINEVADLINQVLSRDYEIAIANQGLENGDQNLLEMIKSDEELNAMSDAEKEAWSMQLAKQFEAMGNNPDKGNELTTQNNAQWEWWASHPERWDNTQNSQISQLSKEYLLLLNRVNDCREKQVQQLHEAKSKSPDLENQIKEGEREILAIPNIKANWDRKTQLIERQRLLYVKRCEEKSPYILNYYRECEKNLKMLMPVYNRMSEIENEMGNLYVGREGCFPQRKKSLLEILEHLDKLRDLHIYAGITK
jgi:hypothetical protein